ncbi:VC0807 family protein [Kutzneria sp. NPDC052558]|uniref:VC0807 family protein n=1 Tax=Kutzneria sp. NPDC052558 TaxID=3364121 RepID=UPI0037C83263
MNKARILLVALLDMAVDIVLPTVVYLVLQPLGVPSVLSLTAGGILVGGKAAFGKLSDSTDRDTVLLLASTIASLAVLFGLYAAGAGAVVAMVAGVVVQGIGVAISIIRRRRLDGFAVLVLTELALGVALSFVSSGDPRFLVARPAFYTFVAAVYVFATVFRGKAFLYVVARPMAVAGDPKRDLAYDQAWRNSAEFRRLERIGTAALGLVLLAEAVLRVVLAFQFGADDVAASSLASQLPVIGLFALFLIGLKALLVPRLTRLVEAELPA